MISEQEKFNLYLTVLRFLPFKITKNLRRIYLDFDMNNRRMVLTAFYESLPTELENELLDDIVTNSNAHIPEYYVDSTIKLIEEFDSNKKYDFTVFAFYDDYD